MSRTRKVGISLVIVGVFIPSVLYPLSSLTTSAYLMQIAFATRGIQYKPTLEDLEVVLVKGTWVVDKKDSVHWGGMGWVKDKDGGHSEGEIVLPYRYIIALGITIAFAGIGLTALSRKKKPDE